MRRIALCGSLHPLVGARCVSAMLAAGVLCASMTAASAPADTLAELSIEELSNVEVTSVSKAAELLRTAPAAIYVITRDELLRSGVTSIVEALRLAPNLHITQYNATYYAAGARGFAGAQEAQNFSNKLLILIDGRSVYSPLFSGVDLELQDVLLEDVDRIEVISGPGATLWGANAMHGVINVITRPAYLTQGAMTSIGVGDQERSVNGRYGGRWGENAAFRFYAKAFEQDASEFASGASAQDDWYKGQAGFRMDWTGARDAITGQGDVYRGLQGQLGASDVEVEGANLLGRWRRELSSGDLQLQAYYDYTAQSQPLSGVGVRLHTVDLELQHNVRLGASHRIVWGAGGRLHEYEITNSASLLFEPNERTLELFNLFLQDTMALSERTSLTVGLKLEHDSFSGWNPLPDVRLAWRASENAMLWASASRAIRSPTPFDHDVVEKLGGVVFLTGNPSFDPEQVDAYELGVRAQLGADVSMSMSAFYNVYDDLRTIEPAADVFLPLRWDNLMEGETYGAEAWAKWQVTERWRLAPGVRWLRKRLDFDEDASELLGLAQSGNDPRWQALLTATFDVRSDVSFHASLRYVDELPSPALDSYHELSAALQWQATPALELRLSGFNLLDASHFEYPAPSGVRIRRSVLAEARWRF